MRDYYGIEEISKYTILFGGVKSHIEYDYISRVEFDGKPSESVFYVKDGDLWGIYDAANNQGTGIPKYSSISVFRNGIAIVSEVDDDYNKKYNLLNDKYDTLYPTYFDKIFYCQNGLYITEQDSKYGILDCNGKEILACVYDEVKSELVECFDKIYVSLRKEKNTILVDDTGNIYTISPNNG